MPQQVSFEDDVIITPANEYEVLQLLLADCRDRFSAYAGALPSLRWSCQHLWNAAFGG